MSDQHNPVFEFIGRVIVWALCFVFGATAALAIWIAAFGDAEV